MKIRNSDAAAKHEGDVVTVDDSIVAVEKHGHLRREATDQLPNIQYVEHVKELVKFLAVLGCASGLGICGLSIWLVLISNNNSISKIEILGQNIETNSIGIAGFFLGAVLVGVTLKNVFRSLDNIVKRQPQVSE